jgi:methionyl aminopeptidase
MELDRLAERLIKEAGGKPSFKTVDGYKWSTCICVNDCIVHGAPNSYILKKGDIVSIDVGMYFKGFHTDTASSVIVANKDDEFLTAGKKALEKAISKARAGNRIGDISLAIQKEIEGAGFSVVRSLVGHGISKQLHEDPQIPCFLEGKIKDTKKLKNGMTIAVEVIYMEGGAMVKVDKKDGWSIRTKDGSRSAMFEHTIAITDKDPLILTK